MKRILILFLLLLAPLKAFSVATAITTQTEVATSTSSAIALAANPKRDYLMIINQDATNKVYLKFGSAHAGAEKFVIIPALGNYEPFLTSRDSVYLESSAGTPTVTILEGSRL